MGLAQVKKVGYGMDGKTLDLVIAVPKGTYLKHFWVANQNDIHADNSTRVGTEYIGAIQNANESKNMDSMSAFRELFEYIGEYTCKDTGNVYDLYRLNQNCAWSNGPGGCGIGVRVSQNDLTFITMEVEYVHNTTPYGVTSRFKLSDDCGEDNVITVFPLYNLLAIRLRALSYAQFINCTCEMPADFMDKVLQIKAIELANLSKEYFKAASYWNRFYKGKNVVTNKRCGCHG